MIQFCLRRLATLIATLIAASAVVFIVMEVLPGYPAVVMLGTEAQPETLAALRRELGIDKPVVERYLVWVGGLASGDLGISQTYRVPVAGLSRMFSSFVLTTLIRSAVGLKSKPVGTSAMPAIPVADCPSGVATPVSGLMMYEKATELAADAVVTATAYSSPVAGRKSIPRSDCPASRPVIGTD